MLCGPPCMGPTHTHTHTTWHDALPLHLNLRSSNSLQLVINAFTQPVQMILECSYHSFHIVFSKYFPSVFVNMLVNMLHLGAQVFI